MSDRNATFGLFIDYDNLMPAQKEAGILDIVTKSLFRVPLDRVPPRAKCEVRIYGGWYEGSEISRLAEDVTIEIQRDFPIIMKLPSTEGKDISMQTNAELAVSLLQEPGHHLFNTYRKKGKPSNVRIETPTSIGCTDQSCILPMMKKLLRSGSCPKSGCGMTGRNLVYRHEQKLVDTMLSCDLIYAANSTVDTVVLVSGDDDFLPPLRTILLQGTSAIRINPNPNRQKASFPSGGASFIDMEL